MTEESHERLVDLIVRVMLDNHFEVEDGWYDPDDARLCAEAVIAAMKEGNGPCS